MTLTHTYRYPFASRVDAEAAKVAAALEGTSEDLFFEGRPRSPAAVARQMLCVADVVRTRFHRRFNVALLDPVVTGGGGMLRLEGFSSCNGVYARADLDAAAFDCDLRGRGTTNVDFNDPMRRALSRVRDADAVALRVGGAGVELDAAGGTVVERKVTLPARWLKGFCEVQAYQPRLVEAATLSADDLRKLLKSVPKTRRSVLTKAGRSWRWASRGRGVEVGGAERLAPLSPLLRDTAGEVRVLADESGVTAWELPAATGRLTLVLSPSPDRGFSGEGQALAKLAGAIDEAAVDAVAAAMRWSGGVDVGAVARGASLPESAVEAALAVLGSRGVAGFDAHAGRYFHRVLPFDRGAVDATQPRLRAARDLARRVEILRRDGDAVDASVPGTDGVSYVVRLRADGDRCNCEWGVRNAGTRGPCKHVLAARIHTEHQDAV